MVQLGKVVRVGGYRGSGYSKRLYKPGQYLDRIQRRRQAAPQVKEQARVGEVLAGLMGQVDSQRGLARSRLTRDGDDDGAFGQRVRVGQRGEDLGLDGVTAGELGDVRWQLVHPEIGWFRWRWAFQRAWRCPVQTGRLAQNILLQPAQQTRVETVGTQGVEPVTARLRGIFQPVVPVQGDDEIFA